MHITRHTNNVMHVSNVADTHEQSGEERNADKLCMRFEVINESYIKLTEVEGRNEAVSAW